jgi:hypothetical protein
MDPTESLAKYLAAKNAVLRGRVAAMQADDCPHRDQVRLKDGHQTAWCGRLAELFGSAERGLCEVRRDACDACCRSEPAADTGLNPVLASLLYKAAAGLLERGGTPDCGTAQASRLLQLADAHLECMFPWDDPRFLDPSRVPGDGGLEPGVSPPPLSDVFPTAAKRCGPGVTMWAVGVTTSPRKQPTLEICLDSLIRAGWERPWLFVDGGTRLDARRNHLPVTYREEKVGAWPNFYLALLELLMRQPEADAYLLVQDDALFYDGENLRAYLETMLWPDENVAAVSLYCPEPYTRRQAGWYQLDETWVWGALALVFSNPAARRFALDHQVFEHRWAGHRRDALIDVVVGAWARRNGGSVYYPAPSLVQHIGQTSTLWPAGRATGKRRANWFLDKGAPHSPVSADLLNGRPELVPVHNSVQLSKLAVVTCGFDSSHCPRWLENHAQFIEGMRFHGIDVVTVEGVLRDERAVLPSNDHTLQYELEDILWHKERLLNLGVSALAADVDAVGWFDADVLFQHDNLCQAILAALGQSPVIQPWRFCEWLDADGRYVPWGGKNRWAESLSAKNWTRPPNRKITSPRSGHPGLAWAARRETIHAMGGLFDRHPLGGGDAMMAIAFWGDWRASYLDQYNEPMRQAIYAWGKQAFAVVQGNVGFVDASVSHLWHGSLQGRKYPERNRTISELGIDPAKHLDQAHNGTWKWAPDTPPTLVRYVKDYFVGRREDAVRLG